MKNKVALVFPGQGSQVVGMGKDLYENFKCAKDVFETINDVIGSNLSKVIFEGPSDELTMTQNAQPALMAVSMAIVAVLEKEFSKKTEDICQYVAGHSLGEYSALCAARSISLEETASLLKIRGSSMAKCGQETQGAMAAILGLEIFQVEEVVKEAAQNQICEIANDNSVGQIVISGSRTAIERAIEISKNKGAKRSIMLPVSGAFHSMLMKNAQMEMIEALKEANIKTPSIPLIANVTADLVTSPVDIRTLLAQQITGSVRWRETMIFMQNNNIEEVIEIGSGKVLAGLVSRTCPGLKSRSIQNLEDIKSFVGS